ncbi:TetR/AcrR family transcriptional regulator [Streptodolium elevatio]
MAHVPASERRPQLIEAAVRLMAREGIAAGSTRAIAAELGVAQATVHYTFGSKRDLYRAVVETLTSEYIDQVAVSALPEGGGFDEQVRTLAHALWARVRAEPGRSTLLTEFTVLALRDPELRDIMRAHERTIERTAADILTGLAAEADQELATPALDIAIHFLTALDGLIQRYLLFQPAPDAEAGSRDGTGRSAENKTGTGTDETADGTAEDARRALDVLVETTLGLCRGPRGEGR